MIRKPWVANAIAAAVACLAIPSAKADFLVEDLVSVGSSLTSANTTYGYRFTVGEADIMVTRLGVYDVLEDGLVDTHVVSLWSATENLLGSVTVNAGNDGAMVNGFVYVSLDTPILLTAGASYVIGAFYPTNEDGFTSSNQSAFTVNSAIGGLQGRYSPPSDSASFPGIDLATRPFGPNLEFTVVPEPAHLAVFGLAGIGLVLLYRRRVALQKGTARNPFL